MAQDLFTMPHFYQFTQYSMMEDYTKDSSAVYKCSRSFRSHWILEHMTEVEARQIWFDHASIPLIFNLSILLGLYALHRTVNQRDLIGQRACQILSLIWFGVMSLFSLAMFSQIVKGWFILIHC